MTTQQDEQFSALVDGELDDANSDIMLNRLMAEPQTRQRWSRYHLISDTLRAKLPEHIDSRFSQSVMAAIEAEPVILAPKSIAAHTPTFRHRAAGFAIAATVAVVAVVGVRNLNEPAQPAQVAQMPSSNEFVRLPGQQQPQVAQAQIVPQQVPQIYSGVPAMSVSSTQSTTLAPMDNAKSQAEYDARLHQYIVSHNQYISGGQFQTMMPYVRIVVSPTIVHDQGQQ